MTQPPHTPSKPPAGPPANAPENREMYSEIAALIAALAKTFALKDSETAAAIESGEMILDFASDANANRYVAATYAGQTSRIYQGAIKHTDATD